MNETLSMGSLPESQKDRKRNRCHMSCTSNRTPCRNQHPESSRRDIQSPIFGNLRNPHLRYPGERFDLRRPIMSDQNQAHDVIDLTRDTGSPHEVRPSRRSDTHHSRITRVSRPSSNIINLDDTVEDATHVRGLSPEITFIRSRPRSRSQNVSRNTSSQPHHPPSLHDLRIPIARSNPRADPHFISQLPSFTHTLQHAFGLDGRVRPRLQQQDQLVTFEDFAGGLFEVPEGLDFVTPGFNIENPSRPAPPPPRLPTYEKPAPPRAGFTRSTNEDDTMVCPNCERELGTGDDELKRQVWVVKSCGHVYCGECTKYRASSKNKPGAPVSRRGGSFARCVVRDCAKTVSAKAMIQVYL